MIEIRQIRHFVAVAEQGSFAKAAETVALTQPALTKSIQKLEDQLELKLFDRTTRKLSLSVYGAAMLPRAQRVLSELGGLERHLRSMKDLATGELYVGVGPFAAETVMGPALGRFAATYPDLTVHIVQDNWEALHERLRNGAVDLFIADRGDLERFNDLAWVALDQSPVSLFCRPAHPMLAEPQLSLARLFEQRLVAPMTTPYFAERLAEAAGGEPLGQSSSIETESLTLCRQIVRESDLIGLAPDPAIADDLAAGRLARLPLDLPFTTNYGIVHLKHRELAPGVTALVETLTA